MPRRVHVAKDMLSNLGEDYEEFFFFFLKKIRECKELMSRDKLGHYEVEK